MHGNCVFVYIEHRDGVSKSCWVWTATGGSCIGISELYILYYFVLLLVYGCVWSHFLYLFLLMFIPFLSLLLFLSNSLRRKLAIVIQFMLSILVSITLRVNLLLMVW